MLDGVDLFKCDVGVRDPDVVLDRTVLELLVPFIGLLLLDDTVLTSIKACKVISTGMGRLSSNMSALVHKLSW